MLNMLIAFSDEIENGETIDLKLEMISAMHKCTWILASIIGYNIFDLVTCSAATFLFVAGFFQFLDFNFA